MTIQKREISVLVLLAALAVTPAKPCRVHAAPPLALDQDKPDAGKAEAELVKALKAADVVFTAKLNKVEPLGQTNSIPASVFGKVTFKDLRPLHGALPKAASFSYSCREGMTLHMDLMAAGIVMVAVKQQGVSVVVSATDANLALAKKVRGAEKK